MGYKPRRRAVVVDNHIPIHGCRNHEIIEVDNCVTGEIVAWLCSKCHGRIRPWYLPIMALDHPDCGKEVISAWLDDEQPKVDLEWGIIL